MAQAPALTDPSSVCASSLEVPPNVFRFVKNARKLALDIGGSLAKIAYSSRVKRKTSRVTENTSDQTIYCITEEQEELEVLHFVKFETKYIESCLRFICQNLIGSKEFMNGKIIKVTGGGAYQYRDLIAATLGCEVDKEDEMECLIKGCNFLLHNISDEAFVYQRHGDPEYKFQATENAEVHPYLLVNIGSGVSLIKVESDSKYERIGGTSMGGGTFWGLGMLLTGARTFDELLRLAESGDHRHVDLLVKDIYGGAYEMLGLPEDLIASSMGKATRDTLLQFKKEDIIKSLLFFISNDIGQIAYLHAQLHGLKRIYFGGYFTRGQPFTMHTISYAINYWSKGTIQALFLRHEGYLGAIGAFLKGSEEDETSLYTWEENYAGSSGLGSPRYQRWPLAAHNSFEAFEVSRHGGTLVPCPLLHDLSSYRPDTVDLTEDTAARKYWLQCFRDALSQFVHLAIESSTDTDTAQSRAKAFEKEYVSMLDVLHENPTAFGSLTVRNLLDMREHCMRDADFTDPYHKQKQAENEGSLQAFKARIDYLDELPWHDEQLALVRGLLAGNIFDWGAKEVAHVMSTSNFGFSDAMDKLPERPWLVDACDAWISRMKVGEPHQCAAVFCDNSGADIVLGVLPFVRSLLRRGTEVILCANSKPALNDVTYSELQVLLKRVAAQCEIISRALQAEKLLVMETGHASPCLDLRYIDRELACRMEQKGVDLIVIEGMGRAVHTNYEARFVCESIKAAVLKNLWLANRLGGDMYSVVFKYEVPIR